MEYKRDFDGSVRDKLPKVISSFANSHGGVLVVGVNTLIGVPQPPFDGFVPPAREELPLTVENICLQNIYPPVFPRTTVVQSDVTNQAFLVIEVEESGEAPHAIENSTKVYVRTGNAANPYDLADVDLTIHLLKRRHEPLELRDRLVKTAENRADKLIGRERIYSQVTICPRFPRTALCSSNEVHDFVQITRYRGGDFIDRNYLHRVPDGVVGQVSARAGASQAHEEINRFGLLFARTDFRTVPWDEVDRQPVLLYGDVFHPLCKFLFCADAFYSSRGFHGTALVKVSLHNVAGQLMTFYCRNFNDDLSPDDFRCLADVVAAERLVEIDRIHNNKLDVLTDFLAELAWSFYQSHREFPRKRLDTYAAETLQQMGLS